MAHHVGAVLATRTRISVVHSGAARHLDDTVAKYARSAATASQAVGHEHCWCLAALASMAKIIHVRGALRSTSDLQRSSVDAGGVVPFSLPGV